MSKNSTFEDGAFMHFDSIGNPGGEMLIARSIAYPGGLVLTASEYTTDGRRQHGTVWLAREDIITLVHYLSGLLIDNKEDDKAPARPCWPG